MPVALFFVVFWQLATASKSQRMEIYIIRGIALSAAHVHFDSIYRLNIVVSDFFFIFAHFCIVFCHTNFFHRLFMIISDPSWITCCCRVCGLFMQTTVTEKETDSIFETMCTSLFGCLIQLFLNCYALEKVWETTMYSLEFWCATA